MATNPTYNDPSRDWPKRGGRMTEEEFHELERLNPDRKYEYIYGMVYMMSGGSVAHDRIAYNIRSIMDRHLTGSCTAFGSEVQVLVGVKKNGKRHYVYPDAAVSCDPVDSRPDNLLVESPKIVFEVLSPGTEKKDRGVKFRAYQSCPTIQEIVLVNQYTLRVEISQRDEQDSPHWHTRYYNRGEIVCFTSIDVHVEIEEFYQKLPSLLEEDEEDEV